MMFGVALGYNAKNKRSVCNALLSLQIPMEPPFVPTAFPTVPVVLAHGHLVSMTDAQGTPMGALECRIDPIGSCTIITGAVQQPKVLCVAPLGLLVLPLEPPKLSKGLGPMQFARAVFHLGSACVPK